MNRLLRITRITASIVFFLVITAALTAAPLTVPVVAQWMEKIQFLPAVMTFSLFIFISWLIITLVFGRVYCSTVCPMGTLQDITACIRLRLKPRDYRYTAPANNVRYITVFIVLGCLMAGVFAVPSIIDPYTAYMRMCNDILAPVYGFLTGSAAEPPAHMTWQHNVAVKAMTGWAGTSIAVITAAIVAGFSARRGRIICNTVCPVGTTLGFIARFSIFQIDIDTDKCTNCRRCEYVCKSCCIDMNDHVVDGSRCVNCFNCINVCPDDAIRYTSRRKQLSIPMMQSLKDLKRVPETTLDSGKPATCEKSKHNDK